MSKEFPDWFEEVKEPERISVTTFMISPNIPLPSAWANLLSWYIVGTNKSIPSEKFPITKEAIELIVNGGIISETGSSEFDDLIKDFSDEKLMKFIIRLKEYCVKAHSFEAASYFMSIERFLIKFPSPPENFYTKKALLDAEQAAFEQSRLTHPMIGFKHKDFHDYKNRQTP